MDLSPSSLPFSLLFSLPHPKIKPNFPGLSLLSLTLRLLEGQKGLKVENKAFSSRLTFFNVSEQDYGNYTCVAYNQLGNTNASIILYGKCGGLFFGLAMRLRGRKRGRQVNKERDPRSARRGAVETDGSCSDQSWAQAKSRYHLL